ncbi:uncharacterized protein LOC100261907 [Vitis vinifera]|uniref:uncharacterized protein LOC100261907 n=1 Tax=Vitis vinifera TaxID=29760 RepID=UPI0028830D18|nr:uncharacterized protein LOC100261907 [Vitis vinifera]
MGQHLIFQLLLFLLLLMTVCVSAMYPRTARLGMVSKSMKSALNAELSSDFVTYYYNQTLDHFNYRPESYTNFQQRYLINSAYWGGANSSSPIFVYTGDEGSITGAAAFAGFMVDLASRFKGLLLIESMDDDDRYYLILQHRYYGDSVPFRSKDIAFNNTSTLGYFSSTQALADYAELITNLKKNLSAENCPVIAIGGSYGGMLASWFRLKYPHVVIGALASSAPILYFDDITPHNGYDSIVTKDFRETSETCYTTIKQSWSEIDEVAGQPNGLANLSQIFRTCEPLNSSQQLKLYLEYTYEASAQYDNPPAHYVSDICNAIDGAPEGTSILGRVAEGVNASAGPPCHRIYDFQPSNMSGWLWQTCTEMVMPFGRGENDTMFQASPFDLNNYTKTCQDIFGASVTPRPHWITTEFGGHNIKSVLGNFASNIIFSNGLRDPYSIGGVLQDISESVVAVYTLKGAHCLDLGTPMPSDPDWLVAQRDKEIKIVALWLAEYNAKRPTS